MRLETKSLISFGVQLFPWNCQLRIVPKPLAILLKDELVAEDILLGGFGWLVTVFHSKNKKIPYTLDAGNAARA